MRFNALPYRAARITKGNPTARRARDAHTHDTLTTHAIVKSVGHRAHAPHGLVVAAARTIASAQRHTHGRTQSKDFRCRTERTIWDRTDTRASDMGHDHYKLMRIDHISPSNICKRIVLPLHGLNRTDDDRHRRLGQCLSRSRYWGHLEERFDGIVVRRGCLSGGMRPGLLLVWRDLHRPPDNSG